MKNKLQDFIEETHRVVIGFRQLRTALRLMHSRIFHETPRKGVPCCLQSAANVSQEIRIIPLLGTYRLKRVQQDLISVLLSSFRLLTALKTAAEED